MLQSFRTMLGRLQKLWQKIQPHQMWLGVFALVVVGAFLFVEPTYAQQGAAVGVGDWLLRQVAKIMLVVASLAIGLSIFFLRFFIMIASYNNYIDVSVVQLGWVMVRDVANMFFVVALLLIAFGTILGLEEYEWKKNLAKLILSAILINFSNLIAQLCIDVAHVFTITFLNAISATAGGNLINMFKLDQVLQLTAVTDPSGLDIELLAAVLPAMLFAIMAAAAIGSYVVVMAARVVALWALIVISPLAFILGVIPQTKSYADKWWAEFSKYVIVAPIMVFFLWLAFATVGLGSIATEIESGLPDNVKTSGAEQSFGVQRLSMSKVTSWENMANFLIAFAFLMYGIKATQETGTLGSGMIGSAVDFGKKVATIASGYAAGRWLVGKGVDGAKAGALATGDFLVGDYIEMAKNKLAKIPKGYQNWKTMGPTIVRDQQKLADERLVDQYRTLTDDEKKQGFTIEDRGDKGKFLVQGLTEMEQAMGYAIEETKDKDGKVTERKKVLENYKVNIKTDADGNVIYKKKADGSFVTDLNGNRVAEGSDKPVYESWLQGKANRRYQKLLSSRKKLEKVENDTKLNEEMMDKSIDAQPTHWLSSSEPMQQKDFDRVKRGMLAAMEARSSAKSGQFAAVGEKIVMGSKRFKDGQFQTERGTIAEQIVEHEANTAKTKSELDEIAKAARSRFLATDSGKKLFEGKIKADLEVKAHDATISNLESGLTTKVAMASVAATDENNKKFDKYRAELEKNNNLPPEEFYKKQEEVLNKMMSEGLIDKDEYDQISQNQKINRALVGKSGMGKDAALAELLRSGVIDEKQKKKLQDEVFVANDRGEPQLQYTFPKNKENVLQRTIAQEKAAHLESEKLETIQKEEEALFAEGHHGQDEAKEAAILKERIAAAEGKVKKADETGKALVSGAADDTDNPELKAQREAFAAARLAKIAADKQAHTESQKSATTEKEAELAYTDSEHGRDELKLEEKLKARQAAAEGGIKKLEAEAAKTFREEFMSQFGPEMEEIRKKLASNDADVRKSGEGEMNALWEKMAVSGNPLAQKLASEKQAHTAEAWSKQMEKSMEEVYFAGDHGQHELSEEAEIKAREGVSEAEIKRRTAAAEAAFKEGAAGAGLLGQSKASDLQGKASEDEIKKAEAAAGARAAESQREALVRSQMAQIFTKNADAKSKRIEAGAQMAAGENLGDVLESTAKQELEASVRQEQFKKAEAVAKKAAYEKSGDALRAQAEIKAKQKVATDTISAQEEAASTSYYGTDEGKKDLEDLSLQAVIKKDAADVLKDINNKILEAKYYQALAKITKAKSEDEANEIVNKLDTSSVSEDREMASYLKALRSSQKIKTSEGDSAMAKEEAEAKADEVFVEMSQKGFSVPSLAAANRAKRDAPELAKAGDQGRAQYLAKNMAHLLGRLKAKKPIEQSMKNGAYSTIIATANGANIDDAVGAIQVLANLTESELRAMSTDERLGIEELKKFAEEMGIVTRNAQGEFEGQNNAFTQSIIAQFQTSGADIDLVRANKDIGEYMEKNKIKDYAVGADKFFNDASTQNERSRYSSIRSAKDLDERYESKQNVLIDAQDELQKSGTSSGHFQMVGALMRDEKTGLVRFTTKAESGTLQTQQKVKNEGTKVAPQALGNLNTNTGFVDIDGDQFETSNVASLNNTVTFVGKTQDRTRRILYGQTGGNKGKLKDGKVVLGDSAESLIKRGSGDYDTGLIRMYKSFINEVKSNATVIALAASSDLGHTDRFDAEAGVIKGVILDEHGNSMEVEGTDDLITAIQEFAKGQQQNLAKLTSDIASEQDVVKKQKLETRKKEIESIVAMIGDDKVAAKLEGAKAAVTSRREELRKKPKDKKEKEKREADDAGASG